MWNRGYYATIFKCNFLGKAEFVRFYLNHGNYIILMGGFSKSSKAHEIACKMPLYSKARVIHD